MFPMRGQELIKDDVIDVNQNKRPAPIPFLPPKSRHDFIRSDPRPDIVTDTRHPFQKVAQQWSLQDSL